MDYADPEKENIIKDVAIEQLLKKQDKKFIFWLKFAFLGFIAKHKFPNPTKAVEPEIKRIETEILAKKTIKEVEQFCREQREPLPLPDPEQLRELKREAYDSYLEDLDPTKHKS